MTGLGKLKSFHLIFTLVCLYTKFAHLFKSVAVAVIKLACRQLPLSPSEPKHIVVSRSFRVALSRCLIHILPLAASLFLITINLKGFYIGQHLLGASSSSEADSVVLALIQIAAKFQVSGSLQLIL